MQFSRLNHVDGKIRIEQIIWCHLFNKILQPFYIYGLFTNRPFVVVFLVFLLLLLLVFLLGIFPLPQKQQLNDVSYHSLRR